MSTKKKVSILLFEPVCILKAMKQIKFIPINTVLFFNIKMLTEYVTPYY